MNAIKLPNRKLLLMIIYLFCLLCFNNVSASSKITDQLVVIDSVVLNGNQSWQLIKSTSAIKIFVKETDCIDNINGISMKKVLIKIENLTSTAFAVEWDNKLRFNTGYLNSNSNSREHHYRVVIEGSSTVEGTCSDMNSLAIYAGMIGMPSEHLLSFQFLNFTIYK